MDTELDGNHWVNMIKVIKTTRATSSKGSRLEQVHSHKSILFPNLGSVALHPLPLACVGLGGCTSTAEKPGLVTQDFIS